MFERVIEQELNFSPKFRALRNELTNYLIALRKASRNHESLESGLSAAAAPAAVIPRVTPVSASVAAS